jgi:hypothetical protein
MSNAIHKVGLCLKYPKPSSRGKFQPHCYFALRELYEKSKEFQEKCHLMEVERSRDWARFIIEK